MNDKPKYTFWQDAYKISLERVQNQLGARGETFKLFVAILLIVLLAGLATMLGLSKWLQLNSSIVKIIWVLLGGNLVVVVGLWIAEPVIAFFRMFRIVAEEYASTYARVQEYREEQNSRKSDLLTTREVNQKDWVGIRVFNGERKRIDGFIKIENIEGIEGGEGFTNALELTEHGVGVDEFRLSSTSHADFDVARIAKNLGDFTIPHHAAMRAFPLPAGVYRIETHLTGTLRDPPYGSIEPKIEYWKLVSCIEEPRLELTKEQFQPPK